MAFIIKDTPVKVAEREIFQDEDGYIAFPSNEMAVFDREQFIPIGVLSYQQFDRHSNEKIFIAVPNLQGIPDGDYGAITYSFVSESDGWRLDDEFANDSKLDEGEDYIDRYQQSREFFTQHQYLEAYGRKAPLFVIGGQPPLGQNWDAILYDEMGDNPELDHYHDVTSDRDDPEFESMSSREITYFDEETEQEFIFLGYFSDTPYLELSGTFMVFYQPESKKVMLVVEYD
ncbi:hypothetical protein [Photobacterium sp. 1_MG-2023]|uniref:hypothetical protein n=1 Tax=Photobacterium sp. 1_MG-2023 TaxID=3062646 RepID=UPI0026E30082|nr:hypothetical protein [Photobacterium sp. 1_MG-2023]MDO6707204.1 hypothetical protein [Photobacterium sp. 1_MG-2023]